MESSCRDLLNDMAERRPPSKYNQDTYHPFLGFTPKQSSISLNGFFPVYVSIVDHHQNTFIINEKIQIYFIIFCIYLKKNKKIKTQLF